jgi:hypothetical protein
MPTQSASAALTSTFTAEVITGFIFYQTGLLDENSGTIKALGRSRWGDLTSWGNYKDWIARRDPIKWTAPLIDLGAIKYFTVSVETEFTGTPNYFDITVSDTGEFAGEETIYRAVEGNLNVPAFYGRYVYVTFVITGSELARMSVTTNTDTNTINLTNINTSTLGGSASARILPISSPFSQIVSMDIRVIATTAYNMDVYVTDTPSSTALVPVVVSKSNTPTFRLVGLDNQARNGIVDVAVELLPRQVVVNGNMVVIG